MRSTVTYGLLLTAILIAAAAYVLSDPLYRTLRDLNRVQLVIADSALFADSDEQLKYGAIYGMVSALDDYSTWHDHATDTLIRREAGGHYGGFGIEIVRLTDTTLIYRVFPESPAAAAGLWMGDRLIRADTIPLVGLPLDSVHTILQSIPGTKVPLHVFRPSLDTVMTIRSERGDISVATVTVPGRLDDIAWLSIGEFNARTAGALERALDTLTTAGVEQFILDLRGNPGGLLQAAVECAEIFMPVEGLMVSVDGRDPLQNVTGGPGPYLAQPLIILVDAGSASGSELMAGCLQDYDRAVLVGRPTFGKGFVQNLFPLHDGSSLRLTVARYLTPTGRTFYRPDSTRANDSTRYTSLVNRRRILGGGRIFPDVDVPESRCPEHLNAVLRGRELFDYVTLHLDEEDRLLDYNMVKDYWQSPQGDVLSAAIAAAIDSLTPAALQRSSSWQTILADARSRELEFDREAASECVLRRLAEHYSRAGHAVPFLDEPLLSTDPALSMAVEILQQPGWYSSLLAGAAP